MMHREDFAARRDEMLERKDALMARADEIRERFAENADRDAVTMTVGLTLLSAGVAWGVTQWLRGRRGILMWVLPVGLVMTGSALSANGAWHRRGSHIDEAEERVRAELATLDPLARVRVMRDMAGESLPFVHHARN